MMAARGSAMTSGTITDASEAQRQQERQIHVFPPSQAQRSAAAAAAAAAASTSQANRAGRAHLRQPHAAAATVVVAAGSAPSAPLPSLPPSPVRSAAALAATTLQEVVDAAADGDCVYVQPGTHELTEPLFIAPGKRIFLIGFTESHTEAGPPTLRMVGVAPAADDGGGADTSLVSRFVKSAQSSGPPLRPMVKVQQGADVFISHMCFEYALVSRATSVAATAAAAVDTSDVGPSRRAPASAGANSDLDSAAAAATLVDAPDGLELDVSAITPAATATPSQARGPISPTKARPVADRAPVAVALPPLPLTACVIEVSGAGTQVTLNRCTIRSDAHGILFRCNATSVGAATSFVASPRLSLREQCVVECPHGSGLVAASRASGFALHGGHEPMSSPAQFDTHAPPDGVVQCDRFASSGHAWAPVATQTRRMRHATARRAQLGSALVRDIKHSQRLRGQPSSRGSSGMPWARRSPAEDTQPPTPLLGARRRPPPMMPPRSTMPGTHNTTTLLARVARTMAAATKRHMSACVPIRAPDPTLQPMFVPTSRSISRASFAVATSPRLL